MNSIAGYNRRRRQNNPHFTLPDTQTISEGDSTHSSKIDTQMFQNVVVEGMKNGDLQHSSQITYHTVWNQFLQFLDGFKNLPSLWEQKMVMFAAHLGNQGTQASTVGSYMSALRYKLRKDGVEIPDKNFEIASIIRTCKIKNNAVHYRCGISKNMLKELLQTVKKHFLDKGQQYQFVLFRAVFLTAYYGMFRIGEIAQGPHSLKMENVKKSTNKYKYLMILRSSKTHGEGDFPHTVSVPQVVDVEETEQLYDPVQAIDDYKALRPQTSPKANFFVLQDGSPIKCYALRRVLKTILSLSNYSQEIFDFHSWRVGRASDLLHSAVPFHLVKKWGNWKSNSILKYFKF